MFSNKIIYKRYRFIKRNKIFFQVGSITFSKDNAVIYRVQNINDIANIIVRHFEKYPLITKKRGDFLLFKSIIELMKNGEHLNKEGLKNIISLKAFLNRGLSKELKIYFPDIVKIKRPKMVLPTSIDYN
jgi:hypothetical protein